MTNDNTPIPPPTSDDGSLSVNASPDETPRPSTTVYSGVYVGDHGNLVVEGDLDVNVSITQAALTKDDYWHTFTTTKSPDDQRDALYHLLELIHADDALAQQLANFVSASDQQRKLVLLRMFKGYHWLYRPPVKLVDRFELLVDDDEYLIQLVAAEVLSKFSHL